MIGYFDAADGMVKVVLKIKGTKGAKEITALFDTGHSGTLSLPCLDLIEIGAEISGISDVIYADGRAGSEYIFRGIKVEINGTEKDMEVNMIPNPKITRAIAGIELFSPYLVILDFDRKRVFFKTNEELKKELNTQSNK